MTIMQMLRIAKPETSEQFDEYFELRWRILRAPWDQPRGTERDEFESVAEHVTVRNKDGRLLGIGRLHLCNRNEAQIRYMATEADSRGMGVGRALIERLEELARARKVERIVLHARDNAVGFYLCFGYSVTGPGPTLFGSVKHSKMEKRL